LCRISAFGVLLSITESVIGWFAATLDSFAAFTSERGEPGERKRTGRTNQLKEA
jgi:hypothetical protein